MTITWVPPSPNPHTNTTPTLTLSRTLTQNQPKTLLSEQPPRDGFSGLCTPSTPPPHRNHSHEPRQGKAVWWCGQGWPKFLGSGRGSLCAGTSPPGSPSDAPLRLCNSRNRLLMCSGGGSQQRRNYTRVSLPARGSNSRVLV